MSNLPAWLPAQIPFGGDWDTFIRTLYKIFERDFKQSNPSHKGKAVWHDRRKDPSDGYGYEEGFWHLTTKDEWVYDQTTRTNRRDRVPDLRRSERLPWCRPVLDHSADSSILAFNHKENNGQIRTYIWLKDWDYVVILRPWKTRKYGTVWMLVTAFFMDYRNARNNMRLKYNNRI